MNHQLHLVGTSTKIAVIQVKLIAILIGACDGSGSCDARCVLVSTARCVDLELF